MHNSSSSSSRTRLPNQYAPRQSSYTVVTIVKMKTHSVLFVSKIPSTPQNGGNKINGKNRTNVIILSVKQLGGNLLNLILVSDEFKTDSFKLAFPAPFPEISPLNKIEIKHLRW